MGGRIWKWLGNIKIRTRIQHVSVLSQPMHISSTMTFLVNASTTNLGILFLEINRIAMYHQNQNILLTGLGKWTCMHLINNMMGSSFPVNIKCRIHVLLACSVFGRHEFCNTLICSYINLVILSHLFVTKKYHIKACFTL